MTQAFNGGGYLAKYNFIITVEIDFTYIIVVVYLYVRNIWKVVAKA